MDGESPGDKWEKEEDRKVKGLVTAQCFPLFSILLALGNPTVSIFSQIFFMILRTILYTHEPGVSVNRSI